MRTSCISGTSVILIVGLDARIIIIGFIFSLYFLLGMSTLV